MSLLGSIKDGSFFHNAVTHINAAWDRINPELKALIPVLSVAAQTAEALTGNAALVPLTQQAAIAAEAIAHAQSLSEIATTTAQQLHAVATSQGDQGTANLAANALDKINSITAAVNAIASPA